MIKISDLKPNPKNPRTITQDRFRKLCQSLREFPRMMELRPIVVDSGNIVQGGNMRLKALKKLGYKEISSDWVKRAEDFTPEELSAFIVKDNVEFGDWNLDSLADQWDAKTLFAWGVEMPEFKDLPEVKEDEYRLPEVITTDIKLGDVLTIGNHRLLCGDSTDKETVSAFLGTDRPDLIHADPPYGISVVDTTIGGDKMVKANLYSEIIGDDTTETAEKYYLTCLALGMKNFIIWGGNYFTRFLPPSKGWIVWDKKGRQWDNDFSDFEMAWSSFDVSAKIFTHVWAGMVQGGTRERRVHPTQKPARLVADCITHYYPAAKCIYDGFGGSGATMVAAHQLSLICLMVEMSPDYCQVIIDRMKLLDPSLRITKNGVEIPT